MAIGSPSLVVVAENSVFTKVVNPVTEVLVAVHSTWSESPSTGKGPNPPGATQFAEPVGSP